MPTPSASPSPALDDEDNLMLARKPVWAYPKVAGFSPPERWGHSTCYWEGTLYIFGGCCGGSHLKDVVALDLRRNEWRAVKTSGEEPGTRDSHSAVFVRNHMFVFGGTNGSTKVNSLHLLDLRKGEWTRPTVQGAPPEPRESHTATVFGDDTIVIFGGSGEGDGNYLNDVHVLDVRSMKWISPEVKGQIPAKRDSHTAVAVGNSLVVYGGDCGDNYIGDVDVLDLNTFTWARVVVQGSTSPGVRAGHASVTLGRKVFVIGGVGDRLYYNDVWILDMNARTWIQLDVGGPQPQGRFSHSAVLADYDIAIYGGCGEDERPLNEIILLQLGSQHASKMQKVPSRKQRNDLVCKDYFGQNYKRFAFVEEDSIVQNLDHSHRKRRKACSERTEVDAEQEEHSQTISRHSSPSHQSEQEAVIRNMPKCGVPAPRPQQAYGMMVQNQEQQAYISSQANIHPQNPKAEQQQHHFLRLPLHVRLPQHPVTLAPSIVSQAPMQSFPSTVAHEHNSFFTSTVHDHNSLFPSTTVHDHNSRVNEVQSVAQQLHRPAVVAIPNLVGAEVRGVVDGAFDSGYLMTAQVNGHVFRGLLFNAAPAIFSGQASGLRSASPNYNKAAHQHQSHTQTKEQNAGYINGTLVGTPVVSAINIGTVIQPATVVRSVPVGGRGADGPTIVRRTTSSAPPQEARCSTASSPNLGCGGVAVAASFGTKDDVQPRHAAESVRGNCATSLPTLVPQSGSGRRHLVWQPLCAGTRGNYSVNVNGHARKEKSRHQHVVGNLNDVARAGSYSSPSHPRIQMDGKSPSNLQMGVGPPTPVSDVPRVTLNLGGAAQIWARK